MHPSLLFWLALALPGYVIVRLLFREDLKSGLLGTVGMSYIAIFGLLTPISIGCYLFELPLSVFSIACILAILAAPIVLSHRHWWGEAFKVLISCLAIEGLVVVIDMILSARVGATFNGDAAVHLARIRFLLDHGFNNRDPFCAVPFFYPIYHTNILHGFYAAASQLTGGDPIRVWFASLPWGKLLIASGVYYMVWSIFDRPWPAWVAVVFVFAFQGPVNFIIYPNKLAPYWLVPFMIGFAVQACRPEMPRRIALKLAIGALLLGQVHGLYALYTVVVLTPVLGVLFLYRLVRRKTNRAKIGLCALAVCLAIPFPLISKYKTRPPESPSQLVQSSAKKSDKHFLHLDNGWLMRNPKRGFGPGGVWLKRTMFLGMILALLGRRRRDAAIALSIFSVAIAINYIPPLCSFAQRIVHEEWVLERFGCMLRMCCIVFGPGAIAYMIESRTRFWWVRLILSLAMLFWFGRSRRAPYDWHTYYANAKKPLVQRMAVVTYYDQLRSLLKKYLPPAETVLVDKYTGIEIVKLYNAYIVASGSSSIGVLDLSQRQKDLNVLLSPKTPWPVRRKLLHKYHIRYFIPDLNSTDWTKGHIRKIYKGRMGSQVRPFMLLLNVDYSN